MSKTEVIDVAYERKAFESWYEVDALPLEHSNWFKVDSDGDYEFDFVADSWSGWKGCAEHKFWLQRCNDLLTTFEDVDDHNLFSKR